jgi:collagen type III alpha
MKFRSDRATQAQVGDLSPFDLWGSGGWCNQEVAGESFNLPHLQTLFGHASNKHRDLETVALLVPEPENKFDANAVAVQVNGATVGHLPRDIAGHYQRLLIGLTDRGLVARVNCRVWGGLVTDYDTNRAGRLVEKERFTASVTIALAEPHLCIPVNEPPGAPHMLLPDGGAIQISGEDQCMPAIEPLLRPDGEAYTYATLHELVDTSGRTAKELIEVRLDGQRVGQLTPKMSSDLWPAVRHLSQRGHTAVSKAKVRGNRLKAEITLHCARAHELSADWPEGLVAVQAAVVSPSSVEPIQAPQPAIAVLPPVPITQPLVPTEPPLSVAHVAIPPKPTRIRFVAPPGWPPPPSSDWEPPAGWLPNPNWAPIPPGWQFWVME